ncbi:MAG: hypothetical protein WBB98_04940 [Xanthobacteraceae bacterium]
MTAPSVREALEAERAELIAKNEAATSWGAAVGARCERIFDIDRQLQALATPPAPTPSAARERIARDTWSAIEQYLDAECGLSCCSISESDRKNCANIILNGSAHPNPPELIAAAVKFLRAGSGLTGLHRMRVNGEMMSATDIAEALALLPDAAAIRAAAFEPADAQINSACLSFRHDYGLLDDHDRERLRFVAIEWLRAWQKEGFGCDRDEVIERCAAVVDQCNREGPYEAIASAKRIRALKSAAIRAAGENAK